jgi:hypothetical protein
VGRAPGPGRPRRGPVGGSDQERRATRTART